MKTLKFRSYLADQILAGEKTSTWRLFDDKNIQTGDKVEMLRWETLEKFAEAKIIDTREKKMGELEEKDWEGHEKFSSEEEMYATYRKYYGDRVNKNTLVKIIKFKLV